MGVQADGVPQKTGFLFLATQLRWYSLGKGRKHFRNPEMEK
jgi:hypothetical protein